MFQCDEHFRGPILTTRLSACRIKSALAFSDCLILEVAGKAGHVPLCIFDKAAGIRNALPERENPLRFERFFGPRTAPTKRKKACSPWLVRAFSNWSRTSFPRATPLLAAVLSNQAARSLLRRIVIV